MRPAIRILLVDDDEMQLALQTALFRKSGSFQVIGTLRNGKDAPARAAELNPDVILLDYQMPEMNGLEVLELLRQQNTSSKIILYSTQDLSRESAAAGADAFIRKGSSPAELIQLVRDVVGG